MRPGVLSKTITLYYLYVSVNSEKVPAKVSVATTKQPMKTLGTLNSHTAVDIFNKVQQETFETRRHFYIKLCSVICDAFYGLATPTLWKSFKNGLASVQRGKHIFHTLYCVGERFM